MSEWPTETTASGTVVLRPTGRLNMVAAPDLREQLRNLVQGGSARVVVDLSDVESIDSSGLGALVQLAKQCNGDGQRFLVVGNARVVQTVKLVRLEQFLHLQPDLDTAIGQLAA